MSSTITSMVGSSPSVARRPHSSGIAGLPRKPVLPTGASASAAPVGWNTIRPRCRAVSKASRWGLDTASMPCVSDDGEGEVGRGYLRSVAVRASGAPDVRQAPQELPQKIGFIGAGQMAEALARGFISQGVTSPAQVCCTNPSQARRDLFESFGAKAVENAMEVAEEADIIFLSVKPQYITTVLQEIRPALTEKKLIVSIAAGITIPTLESAGGPNAKIIRVMPNTPCLVSATAAAMCQGSKATSEDAQVVKDLMSAVGKIVECDEKLFNAVTALSGSGPAYIFLMIEALADGGVAAGLPRGIASQLAAQTVLGSAKMVVETGKHPGQLKDAVCSPAGTTIAGVHELEKAGIRGAFINAVKAASHRADELSKPP